VLSVPDVTIRGARFQNGTRGLKAGSNRGLATRPWKGRSSTGLSKTSFPFLCTTLLWHPTLRLQSQSAIIAEVGTVRRDRICPIVGIGQPDPASKFFDSKILPASDCAPLIIWRFHANSMIPVDRGRGVPHPPAMSPIPGTPNADFVSARNSQAATISS